MVRALRVFFFTLDEDKGEKVKSSLEELGFKVLKSQVVPGFYYAEGENLELKERVKEIVSSTEDWKVTEVIV